MTDVKDLAGRHVDGADKRAEFAAIIDTLSADLDPSLIRTRKQGGADLAYIEWHTAADLLDKNAPGWESEITAVEVIDPVVDPRLLIRVAITVEGVRRENIGIESLQTSSYGDTASNAFSMAFRRAAVLFGVGRELYKKDDTSASGEQTNAQAAAQPTKRGRPPGSKNTSTPAPVAGTFIPAEIRPEANGTSAKGPYTYFPVVVEGKEMKHFFNNDYSFSALLDDLEIKGEPTYPIKVEVKLDKSGKWTNIVAFRKPQEITEVAAAEVAAAAVAGADAPYQATESDIPF